MKQQKKHTTSLSENLNLVAELCEDSICIYVADKEGTILQDVAVFIKDIFHNESINCLVYGSEDSDSPTHNLHISTKKAETMAIETRESMQM